MVDGTSQTIFRDPSSGLLSTPPAPDLQFGPRQPFCGDVEGWGPISPLRFDFTPCFLDVWVSLVAAWGLVMGAGAIWFLLKKRFPQPVPKNWHFYAKLVSFPVFRQVVGKANTLRGKAVLSALILVTALQASIQVESHPGVWKTDFRFWTSIFTLASLVVIFGVQYLEHWRSRQPNGVALFYWEIGRAHV